MDTYFDQQTRVHRLLLRTGHIMTAEEITDALNKNKSEKPVTLRAVRAAIRSMMLSKRQTIKRTNPNKDMIAKYRAVEFMPREKHTCGISFSIEQLVGMPLQQYLLT